MLDWIINISAGIVGAACAIGILISVWHIPVSKTLRAIITVPAVALVVFFAAICLSVITDYVITE